MNTPIKLNGVLLAAVLALAAACAPSAGAAAPAAPAWNLQALSAPTHFMPGDTSGLDVYEVFLTNSGALASDRTPITITDTLPAGLGVLSVEVESTRQPFFEHVATCEEETVAMVTSVTCELKEGILGSIEPAKQNPSEQVLLRIHVAVPAGEAPVALTNRVEVEGGGAERVFAESHNEIDPTCKVVRECAPSDFQEFHSELTGRDGRPVTGAASHPYQYTTVFAFNLNPSPPDSLLPFVPAGGDLKRVEVTLPPGLIANPTATARCSAQQFNTVHAAANTFKQNECPDSSAVGMTQVQQFEGTGLVGIQVPIYNLIPPKGMPAEFGFQPVLGVPLYIETAIKSGPAGYSVRAFVRNIQQAKRVNSALLIFWGTPADPSHDPLRGQCAEEPGSCPAGIAIRPFFRLPSSCENALLTTIGLETWAQPPSSASASDTEPPTTACNQPDFSPTIAVKPTTGVADSPSGLHVDLHLPQKEHEDPEGVAEADLRDATVTLPAGFSVNPSSADGLGACPLEGPEGINLPGSIESAASEPARCPADSKIGTVEVDTPLIDHPLPGAVYLAKQYENPFNSLLAIYIAIADPQTGVVVKLAGKVEPNPLTGQLTTTIRESPQSPFEDFKFAFLEGPRAPLRTPSTCGAFATTTSLTPWSAPESGPAATPSDSFQVTSAPNGGTCPDTPAGEPNAPSFEAGTATPTAGAYSPLVVHLNREDGSQNFSRLNVTLPPGATGKLAGIPECSEAQIAQAQARSHPGEGAMEQSSPSCPVSSTIGTVTVGAGAGPHPLYVTGKAYLAGPYEGAPFSAVFITPALAGPFDLGTVVVRAGLFVNPNTAQVTTKSDPLPSILDGIPLDVRSITVTVDRPGFILNPTNCNALMITGEEISTLGQTAPLSGRFQVGACQGLKFTPKFTVSTTGKTTKASGASLSVKVAYPAGSVGTQTNLARVDLQLPKQLPARLSTLQKACTEAQFNANPAGCPVASMIGTAKAITPLLSSPLTGPAILVSHGGAAFPDVEFLLQGEGVMVVLDGETQIKKGLTYSHFKALPDQPISAFEATFPEGPYSVLATNLPASAKNSLCGQALTLPTTLTAQNGAVINQTTKATVTGCAKTKTLTRAQKLAKALKACHKKPKGAKRKACERQARKQYGTVRAKKKK
jgi:hypothetical protein